MAGFSINAAKDAGLLVDPPWYFTKFGVVAILLVQLVGFALIVFALVRLAELIYRPKVHVQLSQALLVGIYSFNLWVLFGLCVSVIVGVPVGATVGYGILFDHLDFGNVLAHPGAYIRAPFATVFFIMLEYSMWPVVLGTIWCLVFSSAEMLAGASDGSAFVNIPIFVASGAAVWWVATLLSGTTGTILLLFWHN
jgi:hypothetical protein